MKPLADDESSRQFALQQYISLREEIKETKDRLFKVMTFGIVGVPAANYASAQLDMPGLVLLLPALVLIIALMYLSENHGLMRCGRFIRRNIEPQFPNVPGWEKYLESGDEHRSVDRYLAYSFFLLFLLYYAGMVTIAVIYAREKYPQTWVGLLIMGYVLVGIAFLFYLGFNVRNRTVTSTETEEESAESAAKG